MVQQLLWIETLIKLAAGLTLIIVPRGTARLLGLPPADERFWPRLLGAVLIGIAAGALIEARLGSGRGISLGGCIAINLAGAAMLGGLLIPSRTGLTVRGRWFLWALCGVLVLLALIEIAYAAPSPG
jgi:hypothetical protein